MGTEARRRALAETTRDRAAIPARWGALEDGLGAAEAPVRVEALGRALLALGREVGRAKHKVAWVETTRGVRQVMVGWAVKLVGSVGPRELGARGREEQEPAARVPAAQVPVPAAQVPVPAAREAVEMG